jgi:hypothetical protein
MPVAANETDLFAPVDADIYIFEQDLASVGLGKVLYLDHGYNIAVIGEYIVIREGVP